MTGFVYCIGDKPGGPVKLGYARDLRTRLQSMQTSNPAKLHVLASFPGVRGQEIAAHDKFSSLHIRNEWFQDEAEQISRFIREQGETLPDADADIRRAIAKFQEETGMSGDDFSRRAFGYAGFFRNHIPGRTKVKFQTLKKARAFITNYRAGAD